MHGARRWLIGLVLMVAVAAGVYFLLVALGASRELATVAAILVAASMEPSSYFRRYVLRR